MADQDPVVSAMTKVDVEVRHGVTVDYLSPTDARRVLRAALEAAGCERREKFPVFPETAVAKLLRAADMETDDE